jgi:hypothetical protein
VFQGDRREFFGNLLLPVRLYPVRFNLFKNNNNYNLGNLYLHLHLPVRLYVVQWAVPENRKPTGDGWRLHVPGRVGFIRYDL